MTAASTNNSQPGTPTPYSSALDFAFATKGPTAELSAIAIAERHQRQSWHDLLGLNWSQLAVHLERRSPVAAPRIDILCWYYVDLEELQAQLGQKMPHGSFSVAHLRSPRDAERWWPAEVESSPPWWRDHFVDPPASLGRRPRLWCKMCLEHCVSEAIHAEGTEAQTESRSERRATILDQRERSH